MIRTAAFDMHTTAKPNVLLDEDNRVLAVIPPDSPLDADRLAELLNAVEDYRGAFLDPRADCDRVELRLLAAARKVVGL